MSNFICCECGIEQIDCDGAGYKTLKEIELEKKLDIAVKTLERIWNVWKNNPKMFRYIAQYANNAAERALKQIKEKQKWMHKSFIKN